MHGRSVYSTCVRVRSCVSPPENRQEAGLHSAERRVSENVRGHRTCRAVGGVVSHVSVERGCLFGAPSECYREHGRACVQSPSVAVALQDVCSMSSLGDGAVDQVELIIAGTSCKRASTLNVHRKDRRNTMSSGAGSTSSTFVGLLQVHRLRRRAWCDRALPCSIVLYAPAHGRSKGIIARACVHLAGSGLHELWPPLLGPGAGHAGCLPPGAARKRARIGGAGCDWPLKRRRSARSVS